MTQGGKFAALRLGIAVLAGFMLPLPGWGQAAKKVAAPRTETEIEEITVVAQKRAEDVQEVPISIVAITGAALEEKGFTRVSDLTQAVPNLVLKSYSGSSQSMIIGMRGTEEAGNDITAQPSVGMYVDGAYISKILGSNLDLEDLERVEVLRGPQGTLYGRNTIGGAANFITRKPTEERTITLQTEVGNYDAFKARVTANAPLVGKNGFFQSDALGTLSLRETVTYRARDGFYPNALPAGAPTQPPPSGPAEFENLNRIFTMTALRWQPTKAATVDYSFEYHRANNASTMWVMSGVHPGSPVDGGPFNLNPYVRKDRAQSIGNNAICKPDPSHPVPSCNSPTADLGNHRMHILTGTWDLGDVGTLGSITLKSISSYRLFYVTDDQDLDGSPLHVAEFGLHERVEHWSQELQWIGTAPRIQYVLGGYYYGEYSKEVGNQWIYAGGVSLYSENRFKTQSYAPYGQVTYTPPVLSDKLRLTAGIRYTQEQVHFDRTYRCLNVTANVAPPGSPPFFMNVCNIGIAGLQDFSTAAGKAFGGSDGISPMGDISYQWTDNVMAYFRVSRGFKGGTYNGSATVPSLATKPVLPEKLLAYEAGFKTQWFDNRLRFNGNGYYSDYTDMQVTVSRAGRQTGAQSSLENAGKSEIWGSEFQVVAIPLRGLEATVNYGLTLAHYKEYLEQSYDPITGQPVLDATGNPVLVNVANQRDFLFIPDHSLSVGLTYTVPPTSVGTLSAHTDMYWQSPVALDPVVPVTFDQGSYAVFNGRIQFVGIPLQQGSLDIAVFAHNLLDRWYRGHGFDLASLGWKGSVYGPPRTFGLALTYNFKAS